ncbi:MAG TPA: hypothetical protein VFI65_20810 [Streptosporangiaceae bacterium]|nr:hypothetical protein [Streptosporangiaceae bacterium]
MRNEHDPHRLGGLIGMAIARSRLTDQRSPWRWTGALLCAVLAVAGCGTQKPSASHSGHASQTGHKWALADPSPTATSETKKRLAAAYIAIARPANRRLEKANDSYEENEHDNFVIAKRDLRDEVATEREFDKRLLRIDFPANIAEIAWDLVQANSHRIALTERQSHTVTIAKLRAFDKRHKAADAAVEVQVRIIRHELGLPPPDND